MAFQAPQSETNGIKGFLVCYCCIAIVFLSIPFILVSAGLMDSPPVGQPGGPQWQNNMATNFSDAGSIDGITRGICDGDYQYTVSSSGIIQSDNYPASYDPNLSCTNQFDTQADGITFEFQSFMTEMHFDFIAFRDSDGNFFGGRSCSGSLTGNRISVDSSRLPVSIHFTSDNIYQDSGFSIAVSAGYDFSNDLNYGPCGQDLNYDYMYYYK